MAMSRKRLILGGAVIALCISVAMMLDGPAPIVGLAKAVNIESDALGIPRIKAASRNDALTALGYLMARDRLFQMDLLRRHSAGRLAEILGTELVENDKSQRLYRAETVAAAVVGRLPWSQKSALEAYARGVNAFLEDASFLAPEFYALGYRPDVWRAEDSVLIMLGMFHMLSQSESVDRSRTVLKHKLPPDLAEFLMASGDPFTRSLLGSQTEEAPLPVRGLTALAEAARPPGAAASGILAEQAGEATVGSNGFAIAGSRTRDGRAFLANDMHLGLGVPNIWYRAELSYGDVELVGVVLPGVPLVVVGSNRHVAWGFTSLEGDVLDLVELDVRSEHPGQYQTQAGWRDFEVVQERIKVRGSSDVRFELKNTIWGPVSPRTLLGKQVAVRWTALDPQAVDLAFLDMDQVRSVHEAVPLLTRVGLPPLNALLADENGRIGWAVVGRVPRRREHDGAVAVSWSAADSMWDGYLAPQEMPRILDPASGTVVNANQRMPAGPADPALGRNYAHGHRAYRISRRLEALSTATENDLLQIQLDTRNELFDVYRDIALEALAKEGVSASPTRADVRRALQAWDGRAEPSSVGFPLIARFRRLLAEKAFAAWVAPKGVDTKAELDLPDIDTPLTRAFREGHENLFPAASRDSVILAALDEAAKVLKQRYGGQSLETLQWGDVSRVEIAHPLAVAPLLGRLLNMPDEPLAGCGYCVRASDEAFGASERMVVSPGHERDGILHMPAGQSGNPFSSHYRDQQSAWVEGRALRLLTGEVVDTLTLTPRREN